jgi:hypothetical protein
MPVTYRDPVALRPLANVFAITTTELITLAVNVVDDVALFRPLCFDRGGRDFSNFERSEGRAAFKGAAGKSLGRSRRPEDRHDAHSAYGHQNLSAKLHRLCSVFGDARYVTALWTSTEGDLARTIGVE